MTSPWDRRQKTNLGHSCCINIMQSTEGWPTEAHIIETLPCLSIPIIWGFSVLLSQAINPRWVGARQGNTSRGNLSLDPCSMSTMYEAEFPLLAHLCLCLQTDLIPAATAVPIPAWVLAGNRWQISRGKLRRVWWKKCSQDDYRLRKPKKGAFPGGPVVKNLPANVRDAGSIPGLGRSHVLRGNWACAPQPLKAAL